MKSLPNQLAYLLRRPRDTLTGDTILPKHAQLVMLGCMDQSRMFFELIRSEERRARSSPGRDSARPSRSGQPGEL